MADSQYFTDDIIDVRYKLVRRLGEGSFAEAWLAWEPTMSRKVVLKILKRNITAQELKRRFVAEAQIMATLANSDHPHRSRVVSVITVSAIDADILYMALEFVPGGDLQDRLFYEKPSTHTALNLFLMILHGVQVAHERVLEERQAPVIHRDLKPANVLLTKKDEPKVTDFGIANAEHSMTETGAHTVDFGTRAGIRAGTLGYAPPEQMNDASSVDERCDLYSLGVILANLIADFDPGDQGQRLLYQQKTQREHLGSVPTDIRVVIVKACQADPDNRYQDIREFITAVEELIEAHPNTGEAAWVLRPGRNRPAATPTPKTPPPAAAQPAAASAPIVAAPPEGRGLLWTRVDEEGPTVESQDITTDEEAQVTGTPKRSIRWIVGIGAVAFMAIVAMMAWPKVSPTADLTSVETPVEAPAVEPSLIPNPAISVPDPFEAKVETPAPPIVPAAEPKVEPKPEAKTEVKAEVKPKVEVKPQVEPEPPKIEPPPEAEVPKPEVVTAPKVSIANPVTSANVGDTITVHAVIVLPEGKARAATTLRWKSEGGSWQSKPMQNDSGSIVVNATMGTKVEYYVDVRVTDDAGRAIKSAPVTVTVTQ